MDVDENLLRRTFALARHARARGNHPFGALLATGKEVLLIAENEVVSTGDLTQHAELVLVSRATRTVPPELLDRATLYTSTEPCAMCAGAIYWSGISGVVFGLSGADLAALAGEAFAVPCRELFARGGRAISVNGPLLEEEARAVHDGFWSSSSAAAR